VEGAGTLLAKETEEMRAGVRQPAGMGSPGEDKQ
jgi:hypothetical protein